jgi:NADPH-dependent ferric siderophore reductase
VPRRTTTLEVRRTERPTPGTIRVVAGGPGLAGFPDTPHTDRYVDVLFPRPGDDPARSVDLDGVRALPREQRPVTRAYTVRSLDRAAGELALDVVLHGGTGLGGPWATGARAGDVLRFLGPRGSYAPDPDADWHLFVADESALPAVAASVERVPAGVPALAVLEVAGPDEEQPLPGPGDLRALWLHRCGGHEAGDGAGPRPGGAEPAGHPERAGAGTGRGTPSAPVPVVPVVPVVAALRALELPPGRVHAFVHGEAGLVRAVRRHLVDERRVPREHLSVSAYWRIGRTAEGLPPPASTS